MNKIRQVAPDISGIRDDHVYRYQFAAEMIDQLNLTGRILDVGCGVGYGSNLIAIDCDLEVFAIDKSREAVSYACEHYASDKVLFLQADMLEITLVDIAAITMFEVIEHTKNAPEFLGRASRCVKYLFGSVPNQNVVPFIPGKVNAEHYRHYTPNEIRQELHRAGWDVKIMGSQRGKKGAHACIDQNYDDGRTIVFFAQSRHSLQA